MASDGNDRTGACQVDEYKRLLSVGDDRMYWISDKPSEEPVIIPAPKPAITIQNASEKSRPSPLKTSDTTDCHGNLGSSATVGDGGEVTNNQRESGKEDQKEGREEGQKEEETHDINVEFRVRGQYSSSTSSRNSSYLASRDSSQQSDPEEGDIKSAGDSLEAKIRLQGTCDKNERELLNNILDTTDTSPNYSDIHVDPSIIESLERVITLPITRKDAFQRGILHRNRVTGALLYGPPGTGKTLLVKGLAKQSGCATLQITTADVFQKCWGEDEKVIRAIFSLARKLHPCIVFIDEADAIFGSRKSDEQKHVRGMINQFLHEWDGLTSDKSCPFLLLATNRPFDLDLAVLRRAPVHILVDVPSPQGRQEILRVLLRNEVVGADIDLPTLVKWTPSYTGSDLKNFCVSAALASVREQERDPETGEWPLDRILEKRHFASALISTRATIPSKTMLARLRAFQRRR